MKVFKLRKWLCGVVVALALAFITCQASFAANENASELSAMVQTGEQDLTSPNRGDAGIIRHRIPSKIMKGFRETDKAANIHTLGAVQVFSAFASDTVADVTTGDVNVVPVVSGGNAYLYIAFRVTSAMKVDIEWYLDDSTTPAHTETGFEDPDVGGDLSENFWYFAWFNPSSITTGGLHSLEVKVRKFPAGGWFQDTCRFLIAN